MKKQFMLKVSVLALSVTLIFNSGVMAQAVKQVYEPGTIGTAHSSNVSKQPSALNKPTTLKQSPAVKANTVSTPLSESKAALERGLADKSLNEKQVYVLQQKIASMEAEMKNKKTQSPAEIFHASVKSKQVTRAEFRTLTEQQQRDLLVSKVNVTDVINGTPDVLKAGQENVYFLTEDNFRNSDVAKQVLVLNNPSSYKIFQNGTVMPKPSISRAQFNSLSPERREAIIASGQYEITN
jgi:hypothetical protein